MYWPAIAGTAATALFVLSTLPMLIKAQRSRDLSSYSGANLIIANCGNLLQTFYVITLPVGPIWAIHLFNTIASALMLTWWIRCRHWTASSATPTRASQPPMPCVVGS
ncbi:MAG: hypothetical protein WKF57_04170 [Nakamurella sp.]